MNNGWSKTENASIDAEPTAQPCLHGIKEEMPVHNSLVNAPTRQGSQIGPMMFRSRDGDTRTSRLRKLPAKNSDVSSTAPPAPSMKLNPYCTANRARSDAGGIGRTSAFSPTITAS